jgi:hypothetical protein
MSDRQLPSENAPASAEQNGSPAQPIADEITYEQLAALKKANKGDKLSPAERAHLIAFGKLELRRGNLAFAHLAFTKAGAGEGLIAVGDRYAQKQSFPPHYAKDAYIAGGQEIAKQKIIAALKCNSPDGPRAPK